MLRRGIAGLLALFVTLTVASCGGDSSSVQPEIEYKPIILPVKLVIGANGVNVTGESSLVTPVGIFSLNTNYNLMQSQNVTYVVIRNRKQRPKPADNVFQVRTGGDRLDAVVDGHTEIAVENGRVTIDVTAAKVRFIQFKQSRVPGATGPTGIALWWHNSLAKWNAGWARSPYKPFMLARWAYDDATIGRFYGVGFVWFLVRLLLAVVLSLADLILTLVFMVGQLFYFFFGATGANIIWGIFLLLIAWAFYAFVRATRA